MAELKKTFSNLTAFVFSDDLEWVKENLKLDVPMEFVANCESDNEEFHLMSLCEHTIIANNTFSRWAAWLNFNPEKKFLRQRLGRAVVFGITSFLRV